MDEEKKQKLKSVLESVLSDDSSSDNEGASVGDAASVSENNADQEQDSQGQNEVEQVRKQKDNDARNLRLKWKSEKQKREELEKELQQYKEAEEQAKLEELSEIERYKELLDKEKNEKASLMTAKEKAEMAAYEKEIDNLIYQAGVQDEEDVELIRPTLMKKLEQDDFDAKSFFGKLKEKSPGMFKQEERKSGSVGSPPAGNRKGQEFKDTPESKKWGGRSESLEERKEFDKVARKYGITLQKRY